MRCVARWSAGLSAWWLSSVAWAQVPASSAKGHGASPDLIGSAPPRADLGHSWARWLMPDRFEGLAYGGLQIWQWVGLLVSVLGAWVLATLVASGVVAALSRLAARTIATWDDLLLQSARRPVRLLLATLLFQVPASQLELPPGAVSVVGHVVYTGLVVAVAWLILGAINTSSVVYEGSLADDTAAEFRNRSLRTRLTIARSVLSVLMLLATSAILLMQFEVVRSVGVSLLASAGVAGVVLGFAAQKSLSGVIAGVQLSIAQPVRIGDLVQYEGELGSIEEINLTYVVLKLWDERRLVVPISKFIETPVQNWSRGDTQLLGTVFLHADPTLPVARLRAEFDRLCQGNPLWDGRKAALQVTDTSADAITLRALVSVRRADDLFDLRCELREGLVRFLADLDGGAYLPRRRWVQVSAPATATDPPRSDGTPPPAPSTPPPDPRETAG